MLPGPVMPQDGDWKRIFAQVEALGRSGRRDKPGDYAVGDSMRSKSTVELRANEIENRTNVGHAKAGGDE